MSAKPPDGSESTLASPKKKVRTHVELEEETKLLKKKPKLATAISWDSEGLTNNSHAREPPIPIKTMSISEYQTNIKSHNSQTGQESFVVTDNRMMKIINRQKLPVLGYIVGARTMALAQKGVQSDVQINMDREDGQSGSSIPSSSNQFSIPMTLKSW
eukprot:CAMPEP_0185266256 /NCGR_PEP_ID=MMETSP1359-20130426/30488_1 /TAXON_ID=552665 /ORGANISM="Bigelowiella longifila, Strain CCMP242" /LENGTH=157 /DNA_ID=CAMNT_0027855977 /DNA_START=87 /DNA_END=557 /DNA_ORIENTATION=-